MRPGGAGGQGGRNTCTCVSARCRAHGARRGGERRRRPSVVAGRLIRRGAGEGKLSEASVCVDDQANSCHIISRFSTVRGVGAWQERAVTFGYQYMLVDGEQLPTTQSYHASLSELLMRAEVNAPPRANVPGRRNTESSEKTRQALRTFHAPDFYAVRAVASPRPADVARDPPTVSAEHWGLGLQSSRRLTTNCSLVD